MLAQSPPNIPDKVLGGFPIPKTNLETLPPLGRIAVVATLHEIGFCSYLLRMRSPLKVILGFL